MFPLELPPFTWLVLATFPLELPFTWLVLARFRACKSELSVSAGTLLAHRASAKNAITLIGNLYCFMILSLFHGSSNHSSPAFGDLCPRWECRHRQMFGISPPSFLLVSLAVNRSKCQSIFMDNLSQLEKRRKLN